MPLEPGSKLGPYEVLGPLGAGGMGEVYRAKDTRLDRTVAIKVLPPESADDPQRRARFEREARAISALSHPNICTLHDIGEEGGQTFLVMEHLEGQTLAQRLKRGPLPLDQALEVGTQIADALSAAHKQGIVHRDLKPGNVMLTKTGARLLDFGLARLAAHGERPAVETASSAPTEPEPLTGAGTVLGTLPYMAPEQVRGEEVDARTDLWALGAILFEMLTGRRAFEGSNSASLIGAILEREPPPVAERQPLSPPSLERLVRRCVAKDPDNRWDTAHDVADELRWIGEAAPEPSRARSTPRWMVPALIAAALTTLVVGVMGGWPWRLPLRPAAQGAQPVARASINLPPGEHLDVSANRAAVAISPDGSRLAYVTVREDASRQLYLHALDQLEPAPLAGTDGAQNPFFSPDGQWIGFFAGGELKKVAVTGGAAITLPDLADPGTRGATWAPDDTIIFHHPKEQGLWRVSAAGGSAETLTFPDATKEEFGHSWPKLVPGGRAVLYTAYTPDALTTDDENIAVTSLDTGEEKTLLRGGQSPGYAPTGHLVYARAGSLRAVKFDLERLEVTEPSVQVLAGVRTHQNVGAPSFAFAQNGTLVYVPGGPQPDRTLVWVNRQGEASAITQERDGYYEVRLSPDGRPVAVLRGWQNHRVWIYDLSRGTFSPLTHRWDQHGLVWTRDSKRVLFRSRSGGASGSDVRRWESIFWTTADGSGDVEPLLEEGLPLRPFSISPDGEVLAFTREHPTTQSDILLSSIEGEPEPREFLATEFDETGPRFSPDGSWIAYVSDETGRPEVYVRPYPGPGGRVRVSTDGGRHPVWASSGRELFYRNGDEMMRVAVATEPVFGTTRPERLFEGRYLQSFDVSSDGERFLMIEEPETEPVTQLTVVFGWFEELKAKMREAE